MFPSLSVEENLVIGAQVGRSGDWTLERVYEMFPILKERRRQPSTSLSGGQQQMVGDRPRADVEPDAAALRRIEPRPRADRRQGDLRLIRAHRRRGRVGDHRRAGHQQALKIADHVYCMLEGRVALSGPAASLTREAIAAAYFGV